MGGGMDTNDHVCAFCMDNRKRRHRDFSPQIWALLLQWEEVPVEAVDHPMCDDCYDDIRGVLIERADEVEVALSTPDGTDPQIAIEAAKKKAQTADSKRKSKKADKVSKIAS